MRLALAQMNPTVGDIAGNSRRIQSLCAEARAAEVDLLVVPELALCGYPPKDLLLAEGFLAACSEAAKTIGESHTAGLSLVLGLPLPVNPKDMDRSGAPIANALLVYTNNLYVGYYDKRLLPTYDVFDEDRYFTPGDRACVVDIPTRARGDFAKRVWRVGLSICEDLWRGEDAGFASRYQSQADPVAALVGVQPDGKSGAELIVSPSASPFVIGKSMKHRAILSHHARKHGVLVAATNQVGGNDELIFSGHGCVVAPSGGLIAAAPGFIEHMLVTDLAPLPSPTARAAAYPTVPDPLSITSDERMLFDALVLGVRDYCRKTGFKSAVLGLSGGIDSAVCAVLAAAALGPAAVHGVRLPSRYSSQGSLDDAKELAANLGMPLETISIEGPFAGLLTALEPSFAGKPPDVSEENLQSRVRGTILMALSNKHGHILLTTGNKSEMAVGYCTLYGDMNGGLAVLSDVTKHWIYRLSRWMNQNWTELGIPGLKCSPIPESSITKAPSAELRPDQTDQDSLPPYEVLDEIVRRFVELNQHPRRIVAETGFSTEVVAKVVRLITLSEYKRKQAAVGLKVTTVAFGSGRRVPIAQGYRPERELL